MGLDLNPGVNPFVKFHVFFLTSSTRRTNPALLRPLIQRPPVYPQRPLRLASSAPPPRTPDPADLWCGD